LNIATQKKVIAKHPKLTDLPTSSSHYGHGTTETLYLSVVSAERMLSSIVESELNVLASNDVELGRVARTRSGDFYREHNAAAVSSNLQSNNGNGSAICGMGNELRGCEFNEKFMMCVKLCLL
jgi:hypothetical protein